MRFKTVKFIFPLFLNASFAFATQDGQLATPGKAQLQGDSTLPNLENKNKIAGDQIFPSFANNSDLDAQLRKNMQEASTILKNGITTPQAAPAENITTPAPATASNIQPPAANVPSVAQAQNFNPPPPYVSASQTQVPPPSSQPPAPAFYDMPNGVRIFSSNIQAKQIAEKTVELPATSVALGHLMEGIEVGINGDSQTIGISLDYAFLGPNGGYVQMKSCNILADVKAKYSFSRLRGDLKSMTCRAPNGQVFTIPVQGHIISAANQMEYKGLDGTIIMPGKGTAAILTFLQGAVTSFGQAMSAAQVQTQATTGQVGSPVQSSNVMGNQNMYIAGQTIAGAAGSFMQWFVDFYKSMEVGVAVEQGRKTFVMLENTVLVPKIFFGDEISKSFVSYVNNNIKDLESESKVKKNSSYNTAESEVSIDSGNKS